MTKPFQQAKADFVRDYLALVLGLTKGRTCAAARMAGMSSPNFCKLLRINGIKAEQYR